MEKEDLVKILVEADEAYNGKQYLVSFELLNPRKQELIDAGVGGPALQRMAWCAYYLGNEKNLHRAEKVIDDPAFYEEAVLLATEGLNYTGDPAVRIPILEVLSLSIRWTKEEDGKFRRIQAYAWASKAVSEAEYSGRIGLIARARNTEITLLREDGKFGEAKAVSDDVFGKAVTAGDYRYAGHAQQNKGDVYRDEAVAVRDPALRKLLYRQAHIAYRVAQAMYALYERNSGEKATAHFESAKKKAEEVAVKM